jgi:hypothetical protein
MILSNAPEKEKYHILNKRIIEILSEIEDDIFYDKFGYNTKIMKKRIIQNGLQLSLKKDKMISSIYYLNDYYKIHFVIVNEDKGEYYETTVKNYPRIYLLMNKNKFIISDTYNSSFLMKPIDKSLFETDVKSDIYKTYLNSISKYKIKELKDIAATFGIDSCENSKSKTKKTLFDEINLYNLNLI